MRRSARALRGSAARDCPAMSPGRSRSRARAPTPHAGCPPRRSRFRSAPPMVPPPATAPPAKDLSQEEPRPMDATLDGYPWLPRMLDKARAADAGILGGYFRYPCPIDRACLDLLGIGADAFRRIACASADDDTVRELAQ